MSFIRESNRGDYLYYVYEMEGYSVSDAVHWVVSLINRNIVSSNVIALRDSFRSNDEGNTSIQIKAPLDEKKIINEINDRQIDKLSVDGKFNLAPLSVVYNLKNNRVSIGLDSDHVVDRYKIETKMRLI